MKDRRVNNCVIIKREIDNQEHLVAYIETTQEIKQDIISLCKQYLRSYMVPTIWMMMDKFPLNKNGKVDRKRLPEPKIEISKEIVEPVDEIEREVWRCFSEVLNHKNISMKDHIQNDLILTSIQLISVVKRLKQCFNKISIITVLKNPTLEKISQYLKQNQ